MHEAICTGAVLHLRNVSCRLLDAAIGSHVQNGSSAAEMGLAGTAGVLPPQYVNFKESTRSEMLEIKAKMGELRKLHGQVTL